MLKQYKTLKQKVILLFVVYIQVQMTALKFLKLELISHNLQLKPKNDGREGVDFLIGNNLIYQQLLDLDIVKQSIKILKKHTGDLSEL